MTILEKLGGEAIESMKEAVRDGVVLALGGGKIGGGGAGAGGAGGGGGKLPIDELKTMATNASTAATALFGIKQPGNEVAGSLGRLAGMVPMVGSALSGFITTLGEAQRDTIKSNSQGVGGNSMFDLSAKTRLLEMTTDDYRTKLKDSGNALTGFNMTAQGGSEALLTLGKNTRLSDAADGNKSLVKSGMMAGEELAKVAMIAQYGRTKELESQAAQSEAAEASKKLAKTIYDVSQATGKSTVAIEAELAERLKQPEIMGAMEQMSEKQRESFIEGQAKMSAHGSTMADLSAKLATGQRLNPDDIKTMMTLGPAAGDMQRAMRMTAMATTEDQKAQAAQALKLAEAKAAEYQGSKQYTNVMQNASPEIAAKFKQVRSEDMESSRIRAGERQIGTKEPGAVQDAQKKESDLRLQGLKKDETTGDVGVDKGQTSQRKVTDVQQRLSDNSAAAAAALNGLDTRLAKMPGALDPLNKLLDAIIGKQVPFNTAAKQFGDGIGTIVNSVEKGVTEIKKLMGEDKKEKKPNELDPNRPPGAPPASAPPAGAAPVPTGKLDPNRPPGAQRAGGSKEATGDWFENFGTSAPATLHGKEAVVPEGKLSEFMKDMMGKMPNMSAKADDTAGKLPKAEDILAKMPKGDDATKTAGEKASSAMKDTMSSMPGNVAPPTEVKGDGKEKAAESVENEDTQKWMAIFKSKADFKSSLEKENATKDIADARERLADRQNTIATLQKTASQRELTDKEKEQLQFAENGARRATNNIANDQARLSAIESLEKQNLTKSIEGKKEETSKIANVKDMSTAELIARDMTNVQNMTGKVKDVKDMSTDELIKRDMANIQNMTGKVKDVKDMSTAELIARDMTNVQNMTGKVKDVKDMSTDDLIKRDMANIQNMTGKVKDVKDMSTDELIKRDMANVQNKANKVQGTVTAQPTGNNKMQEMQEQMRAWKAGIDPAEMAKAKAAKAAGLAEAANNPVESIKAPTTAKPKTTEASPEATSSAITLKDLHNDLQELNKSMKMMVSHSEQIKDHSAKTAKNSARAPGNRAIA